MAMAVLAGCSAPKTNSTQVDAVERVPLQVSQISLEQSSPVRAGWAGAEGALVLALESGKLVAVDERGQAEEVPNAPGEQIAAGATTHFAARDAQTVLAFGVSPRWVSADGIRAVVLPSFLSPPTGLTHAGTRVIWASTQGLFTASEGDWLRLDDDVGAVVDATTLVGFEGGAWVLRGTSLQRMNSDGPTWTRYPEFSVRQLTSMGDGRVAVSTERGVSIVDGDDVKNFHRVSAGGELTATAIGGGGGWAWVLWGGSLLRTDGTLWEALLTDTTFGVGSSVSVDDSGASAVIIDASGRAFRVLAQETLRLSGVAEETWVSSTSVSLMAAVEPELVPAEVRFTLDGQLLGARNVAPFGWGLTGEATRELGPLTTGVHRVDVRAELSDGGVLSRRRSFFFQTPESADAGAAPSYAVDIKPIYETNCARCHTRPVAHDLSTYEKLSDDLPVLRSALAGRRMPTDILLDKPTLTLFLKWIDRGAAP